VDLGEHWEKETGAPIPLGGIVVRKAFDLEIQQKLDRLIMQSVQYSFKKYPSISTYVSSHSQEMSEDVMRKHINLYVNNFSINPGEEGKAAVKTFLDVYAKMHGLTIPRENVFVVQQ
jgi:1,4-dihydroxy-6-naphthoate synthase